MSDPYRREAIEGWVGDFCESSRARELPSLVREYAPEVLAVFLASACDARDVAPSEIEGPDLKPALLEGVARLEIPGSAREDVPRLCQVFLEALEEEGRLGGGRVLGLQILALKPSYLRTASGKGETYQAPAAKVGRNDPCPCGSGLKYKKCCMRRLDG